MQRQRIYQIAAPAETHTRPALCIEVDCPAHLNGWRTIVDETTDLGIEQAAYIRVHCWPAAARLADPGDRRRYHESRDEQGLTVFEFPAGQQCFEPHRVPLERPAIYVVRDGGDRRVHQRPGDWTEDCHEHTDRIAALRQKG